MTQKLLLNVNEVASALGCGRTYVYGMIQRGELPVVKLGRLTRIQVSTLAEFVSRQALVRDEDPEWGAADGDLGGTQRCGTSRIGNGLVGDAGSRDNRAAQRGEMP